MVKKVTFVDGPVVQELTNAYDDILSIACSLLSLDEKRQIREIAIPCGVSRAKHSETHNALRLVLSSGYLSWYEGDKLVHCVDAGTFVVFLMRHYIELLTWQPTALEESLVPKGNRLFRRYVAAPRLSTADPVIRFYALVDVTQSRDIHVYRNAFLPSDDIAICVLDQGLEPKHYTLLPQH